MDLDGFKSINDSYGHDIGDGALIVASTRIKEVIRGSELLARVGGDEFALLVEEFSHVIELSQLANRIIAAMEKPVLTIHYQEIKLGISIGIACYPKHAKDREALISAADSAMYVSKGSGRNRFTIYQA